MKKLFFFVLILIWAQNAFASPLVFKATKEVKSADWVEIALFDASKYKQVRIGITDNNVSKSILNISAVEDEQEIFLAGATDDYLNHSVVLDSPPPKIKISVRGEGTYRLFIWASL
jgi:hypothetical protein